MNASRIKPMIRRAVESDLPNVVRLLSIADEGIVKDDSPSEPLDSRYAASLAAIASDPNNMLLVSEVGGRVAGAFHFTTIQYVTHRGGRVGMIESVIVDPDMRGQGIGEAMMRWAVDEGRRRGCLRLQLTSNKVRKRARAFYERLGFVASHEGMKLRL